MALLYPDRGLWFWFSISWVEDLNTGLDKLEEYQGEELVYQEETLGCSKNKCTECLVLQRLKKFIRGMQRNLLLSHQQNKRRC